MQKSPQNHLHPLPIFAFEQTAENIAIISIRQYLNNQSFHKEKDRIDGSIRFKTFYLE